MKKILDVISKNSFLKLNVICILFAIFASLVWGIGQVVVKNQEAFDWEEFQEHNTLEFKDQTFKRAVAEYLNCTPQQMDEEYLEEVTTLTINNVEGITCWEDLSYFKGLKELSITRCELTDLTEIVKLKDIEILDISWNEITDIKPLLEMKNLKGLSVAYNPLEEIPNPAKWTELETLDISATKINDLEFMRGNTSIKKLSISHCEISSLCELENSAVESLKMYGIYEIDLAVLEEKDDFHSIYVDKDFDHTKLDFMVGNFKDADKYTKAYLIQRMRGFN